MSSVPCFAPRFQLNILLPCGRHIVRGYKGDKEGYKSTLIEQVLKEFPDLVEYYFSE